jgi:hypothetical protein
MMSIDKRLMFGAAAFFLTLFAPVAGKAESNPRINLAVFDFELDDFSAGGPITGESAVETAMLRRATGLARERLSQSGLCENATAARRT